MPCCLLYCHLYACIFTKLINILFTMEINQEGISHYWSHEECSSGIAMMQCVDFTFQTWKLCSYLRCFITTTRRCLSYRGTKSKQETIHFLHSHFLVFLFGPDDTWSQFASVGKKTKEESQSRTMHRMQTTRTACSL